MDSLSLLPKLRDKFAEFLQHGSLKRLRLLDVFTSVGLQYGDRKNRYVGMLRIHLSLFFEFFLENLKSMDIIDFISSSFKNHTHQKELSLVF